MALTQDGAPDSATTVTAGGRLPLQAVIDGQANGVRGVVPEPLLPLSVLGQVHAQLWVADGENPREFRFGALAVPNEVLPDGLRRVAGNPETIGLGHSGERPRQLVQAVETAGRMPVCLFEDEHARPVSGNPTLNCSSSLGHASWRGHQAQLFDAARHVASAGQDRVAHFPQARVDRQDGFMSLVHTVLLSKEIRQCEISGSAPPGQPARRQVRVSPLDRGRD